MDCYLLFLAFAAIAIVVASLGVGARARSRPVRLGYARLARQRYGVFTPGGWFRRHRVHFRHGAVRVALQPRSLDGVRRHEIEIDWPDSRFRCEVSRDQGLPRSGTMRGLQEVAVGADDFDRRFVVFANDPPQAHALLSPTVQSQIDRLQSLLGGGEARIRVRRGKLVASKAGSMRRYEELEAFTRLVLELYDQAMLARCAGIEFLGGESAQVVKEAICQVCGEDIVGEDMVVCVRCKTPHHRDCWQYNGGCAVYGCRETRCIEAR